MKPNKKNSIIKDYISIFKAEVLKLNVTNILLFTLMITSISVVVAYFSVTDSKTTNSTDELAIIQAHLLLYMILSYPMIVSTITSLCYKVEFDNHTKINLYLQPVSRYRFFIVKLIIVYFIEIASFIFLIITYYIIRFQYISILDVQLDSSFYFLLRYFEYAFGIVIFSTPMLVIFLLLSSFKFPMIWSIISNYFISVLSMYLVTQNSSNIWWNIFIYPLLFVRNLNQYFDSKYQAMLMKWFSAYNIPFNFISLAFFSTFLLVLANILITKFDRKY